MASIANNYEINVSRKRSPNDEYGEHWCRIELPDSFEGQAEDKLKFLRDLFGEDFRVTMHYWKCYGINKEGWD